MGTSLNWGGGGGVPFRVLCIGVPYSIWDLKRDANIENDPHNGISWMRVQGLGFRVDSLLWARQSFGDQQTRHENPYTPKPLNPQA